MTTSLNIWHFFMLFIIISAASIFIYTIVKKGEKKIFVPMIFSVVMISILIGGFSMVAIDKYTKVVKLYKVKNKRILSIEKIIYTGIVKNEGDYNIGEVTFEIKLVNKGHVVGKVASANWYTPSGFGEIFGGGANLLYKPQTVTKTFVVAKNLRPGEAKSFRVHFDYPGYFRSVSQFYEVYGH